MKCFPKTVSIPTGAVPKVLSSIYNYPLQLPPYTGGELITKRFLPLCKGELEGVVVDTG